MIGQKLGPYEVLAKLGEGGMGEVYRARDTRLKRDVAIKVLPDGLATETERLARFHREAELLASLNHPNIAAIYGVEEFRSGGSSDPPITGLVLELIEGETLADRLARGPIRFSDAMAIARQLVEAFDAAHGKNVIHRDLKPANIKITPDDKVKVLDFGLAAVVQSSSVQDINVTHSPTLTLNATRAGVILGTAAYMSPEQATGSAADKRADVWAFGVVLWEMLTGRRIFEGETVSHTLAFVITKEPDWTVLPSHTPPSIRRLLRRCLEKDRKRRLPDIASAQMEIDDAVTTSSTDVGATSPAPPISQSRWQRALPWAFGVFATIALAVVVALWAPWRIPPPLTPVRVAAELGVDALIGSPGAPSASLALSPDGRLLAFVAGPSAGGPVRLYIRRLDQLQATALSGTESARDPFFSPDGETSTFWVKSVDVLSSTSTGAIVAFGDSITDGTCSTLDGHDRWEDVLAMRLAFDASSRGSADAHRAVVNEGIGGNTITREKLQPPPDSTPGLERLDRDVLSHHGVSHVVLFMGTNDARRDAMAAQIIAGTEDIVRRVKRAGLKVIGVTMIPRHNRPAVENNTGWSDAKTRVRNDVNQWIRTKAPFDAVIDFDKAVKDPGNTDLINPPFNCGDGIHPSPRGYYAMGRSVALNVFK